MKKDKLELISKDLKNQTISRIRTGYGSILKLEFGELIEKVKGNFKYKVGSIGVYSDYCSWRVEKNCDIICGSYDEAEFSDSVLLDLVGVQLQSITCTENDDILFTFDKGYKVLFLRQSATEIAFTYKDKEDQYFEYDNNLNVVQYNSNNLGKGLSKIEEQVDIHSSSCSMRWAKYITDSKDGKYCSQCIYFRPLRGEFYFWDYGVCSNENSESDRKLVGVKSGCGYHCDDWFKA